jgi:hypothetical protein
MYLDVGVAAMACSIHPVQKRLCLRLGARASGSLDFDQMTCRHADPQMLADRQPATRKPAQARASVVVRLCSIRGFNGEA